MRSSVFLLLYHAKFMVKYWNYRPYHVSISYRGTVKPVESEYGAVSFTMTSTQEYQAIPCISHFGRSRDTYFSCCEVSARRILQVPKPYSLIFSKTFPAAAFGKLFPPDGEIIR